MGTRNLLLECARQLDTPSSEPFTISFYSHWINLLPYLVVVLKKGGEDVKELGYLGVNVRSDH